MQILTDIPALAFKMLGFTSQRSVLVAIARVYMRVRADEWHIHTCRQRKGERNLQSLPPWQLIHRTPQAILHHSPSPLSNVTDLPNLAQFFSCIGFYLPNPLLSCSSLPPPIIAAKTCVIKGGDRRAKEPKVYLGQSARRKARHWHYWSEDHIIKEKNNLDK